MKPKCPNIDKDTLNILKKISINPTINNRILIFYCICIIVRLLLAKLAYTYKDKYWIPYLTIMINVFIIYRLKKNLYGNWWWSRPFHLVISILLVIVSILIILGKMNSKYISYLLFIDVMGGFINSLLITRC
jgi:hypothetical protein